MKKPRKLMIIMNQARTEMFMVNSLINVYYDEFKIRKFIQIISRARKG
jgi:hypothetical protein